MSGQGQTDVAVITGAVGGMGAACAAKLAARAHLLLTDLDAARLDEVARTLPSGASAEVVPANLGSTVDIAKLADACVARGGVRWLVHTAGLSPAMAGWREVLEIDLAATAALLEALEPHVQRGGAGVCFASIAGQMGTDDPKIDGVLDTPLEPDLSGRLLEALGGTEPGSGIAYLYAKRGVIRLCERLAGPWGKRGARIVSISPGLMDTSMGRLELEETLGKREMIDLTPLDRAPAPGQSALPGRADDIADAVDFLCSDAASFVTGCDLRIDGGIIPAMRWADR